MERVEFEPFGERLAPVVARRGERASKWLLWVGSAVFWSLAAAIVLARAIYFDPGVFVAFGRVAVLARYVIGL
jgi:hypothetical protein